MSAANFSYPGTSGRDEWEISGLLAYVFANRPPGKTVDLVFSGFGFSSIIPPGAAINAIQFGFLGSADDVATDARIVLRVGGGPDSENRAKVPAWATSLHNRSYGDLVGDTWGLADAYPDTDLSDVVRSPDFSAAIQINNIDGFPDDLLRTFINGSVTVTVDWSVVLVEGDPERTVTIVETGSNSVSVGGGGSAEVKV